MANVILAAPSVELTLDVIGMLEDSGHSVIHIEGAIEAGRLRDVDVLIVDVELEPTALEALRKVARLFETPVIAMSSRGRDEHWARACGAAFIERPPTSAFVSGPHRRGAAGGATLPDVMWGKVLIDLVDSLVNRSRLRFDSLPDSEELPFPTDAADGLTAARDHGEAVMSDILVVDDDHCIRETLREILTDEGYRVAGAANGLEALQMVKELKPRMILLDLMMPVMNGWELQKQLTRDPQLAGIPVTVISAVVPFREPGTVEPHSFIKKPVNVEELVTKIQAVLG